MNAAEWGETGQWRTVGNLRIAQSAPAKAGEGAFDRFRSVQRGRRIDIILSKGIYQGAWQDVGWTIDSEKTSDEGRYVDLDGVGLALAMD